MRVRKKPIEVLAHQLPPCLSSAEECPPIYFIIADWCGGDLTTDPATDTYCIDIPTREGVMTARPGDWIIEEPLPTGEPHYYPCRPDIFERAYELVTGPSNHPANTP